MAVISFEGGESRISDVRVVNPPDGFTLIEGTGFGPGDDRLVYIYARLEENVGRGLWGDVYLSDPEGGSLRP